MNTPNEILKRYWGHSSLRPAQKKTVEYILNRKDVICLLPTGGGKSICFQVPALLQKEGICIVISPLISLMQDQVENLKRKGIKAMMLAGHISFKDLMIQLDNCMYGGYKFLYLSPERLQNELVQERIQQMNVNLVAIDEAHCISEWGHDFRPAYRGIAVLKELLPEVNFIALTATATERVLKDISENLELTQAKIVKLSFERKNISLLVKKSEDKNYELQKFLHKNHGVSIVYVRSRQLTQQLCKFLKSHQISAKAYHGGMTIEQKQRLLKEWQSEQFEVMVATNAFGMGIDKANVRSVIHFHLPDSLESYYQEVGRAGRDNRASKAFLIYNNADILKLKTQFLTNSPNPENLKTIYKKLNSYFSIAYGEGQEEQFNFNFLDFCNTYSFNTYLTYNVLQLLDRLDVISLSNEFHQRTELFFKISHVALDIFLNKNRHFQNLIHSLLRMQGGFFDYKTTINLKILQNKTGLNQSKINSLLKNLEQLDVIDLTLADQDSTIEFLVPREDHLTINPLVPYIKQSYKNKKTKINAVINFIENQEKCRVIQLLSYFDEEKQEDCGHCSVCLSKKRHEKAASEDLKNIRQAIVKKLQENEFSSKQLVEELNFTEEHVLFVIKRMLDLNEIKISEGNTYFLS